MEQPSIVVTQELLRELKKRAAEANSVYALARRAWNQQRREARTEKQKEKS